MPEPFVLNLWPDLSSETPEIEYIDPGIGYRFLRNVTVPTLTAFLPEPSINTGTAMVVCPGGGLHVLAIDYEGLDVAHWLCERGIAAFVLKYRIITTPVDEAEHQAYFAALLDPI